MSNLEILRVFNRFRGSVTWAPMELGVAWNVCEADARQTPKKQKDKSQAPEELSGIALKSSLLAEK